MIEKVKALCVKYREIIVYIIVGGLTTLVGWGSKFLFNWLVFAGTAYPTAMQNTILSVVENVCADGSFRAGTPTSSQKWSALSAPASRRWSLDGC